MDAEKRVAELEARVKDLEAALKQNNPDLQVTFRLTPVMTNLLGLLIAVPLVTQEMVEQRLGIATEVKVAMHRLRQSLKPFGIEIESRRTLGYWLSPQSKAAIQKLIGDATSPGNLPTDGGNPPLVGGNAEVPEPQVVEAAA